MTAFEARYMAGHLAHGWLPAIGLTRVLAMRWPEVTIHWHPQWGHPIWEGGPHGAGEAANAVRELTLDLVPEEGVGFLPGVWVDKAVAGSRGIDLARGKWHGPHVEMWRSAMITPTGDLHPLVWPHAQQTLPRMAAKAAKVLSQDPRLLTVAIGGPGIGLTAKYGAGLWIARDDTPERPMASPGRDWLALMGAPWTPLRLETPRGTEEYRTAVGWHTHHDRRYKGPILRWSLWTDPIPASEVPEVLRAQDLDPSPQYHASRRRPTSIGMYDPPMLVSSHTVRGPGRPPAGERIIFQLPEDVGPRIDDLIERLGLDSSRDDLMRSWILDALQAAECEEIAAATG